MKFIAKLTVDHLENSIKRTLDQERDILERLDMNFVTHWRLTRLHVTFCKLKIATMETL